MQSSPHRRRVLLIVLMSAGAAAATGCSNQPKPSPRLGQVAAAEYDVSPKQLLETVRQVVTSPPLSLPIEQEHKGMILTGYQDFPGQFRIARKWQEHTRYRISVIPDFDEPARHSRLEVAEETQQRATDGQAWQDDAELQRPERAAALLRQIEERVKVAGGRAAGT
jgi:hypothetical protein